MSLSNALITPRVLVLALVIVNKLCELWCLLTMSMNLRCHKRGGKLDE